MPRAQSVVRDSLHITVDVQSDPGLVGLDNPSADRAGLGDGNRDQTTGRPAPVPRLRQRPVDARGRDLEHIAPRTHHVRLVQCRGQNARNVGDGEQHKVFRVTRDGKVADFLGKDYGITKPESMFFDDRGIAGLFTVRTDGSGLTQIVDPVGMELNFDCGNWSPSTG